jgi:3-oxoacyl-[acyl-carrier protein] reductase
MRLEGARILITGGATGIGRAIAEQALEGGARVAICGRRAKVVEDAVSALGKGAYGFRCDVSREEQVEALFGEALEALGGLDVLVNNAAFGYRAPLVDVDAERFREVHATNVVGAMLCGRAAARHFVERGAGTIVNVGSTAASKGYPGGSAYASSKFALTGLTESWRAELRPHGVRVMQVNPSEVQTPFGGREASRLNPTKLVAADVAHLVLAMLTLEDRGFVNDATLWATNPQ